MSDYREAELTVYVNDESVSISLTPMQTGVIAKILGLSFNPDGTYDSYTDETLKRLCAMKGNPLRARIVTQ